jgi:hypothetical protein
MEISNPWRPLRTWIPILILPAMLLVRFIPDLIPNGPSNLWMASAFGPFLIGLLVVLWWLVASRARWFERLLGLVGLIGAIALEQAVCHESMRGALLIVMTIPMAIAGFGIGCILFGRKLTLERTWLAIGLALLAAGYSALLRTDGVWGNFAFGFDWRWNPTSEQKAISQIRQADLRSVKLRSHRRRTPVMLRRYSRNCAMRRGRDSVVLKETPDKRGFALATTGPPYLRRRSGANGSDLNGVRLPLEPIGSLRRSNVRRTRWWLVTTPKQASRFGILKRRRGSLNRSGDSVRAGRQHFRMVRFMLWEPRGFWCGSMRSTAVWFGKWI